MHTTTLRPVGDLLRMWRNRRGKSQLDLALHAGISSRPVLVAARKAVDLVLTGHEPYPALAIDRHWNMVAANRAVAPLMHGVAPELVRPPINVLRLSLHPDGIAPRIVNLAQWRDHVLARLARQVEISADPVLEALRIELRDYPVPVADRAARGDGYPDVVVPLQLRTDRGVLSFFSTTTVFGTAVDITLSELAIEAFFPADANTAEVLRSLLSS